MTKVGRGLCFAFFSLLACTSLGAAPQTEQDQAVAFTFDELGEMCHYFFVNSGRITMELMTTTIKKEMLMGRKFPEPGPEFSYDTISISTDVFEPFKYLSEKKTTLRTSSRFHMLEYQFQSYNVEESLNTMKILLMSIQYLKPRSLQLDLPIPTPTSNPSNLEKTNDWVIRELRSEEKIMNSCLMDIGHLVIHINSNLCVSYVPGLLLATHIFSFYCVGRLDIHVSQSEQNMAYIVISELKAKKIERAEILMYNRNENPMIQVFIPSDRMHYKKELLELRINLDFFLCYKSVENFRNSFPYLFPMPEWVYTNPKNLLQLPVIYYDNMSDEMKDLIRAPHLILSAYSTQDQENWRKRAAETKGVIGKNRPPRTLEISIEKILVSRIAENEQPDPIIIQHDIKIGKVYNRPRTLSRNYLNMVEDIVIWAAKIHPEATDLILRSVYTTETASRKEDILILLNAPGDSRLKRLTVDGIRYWMVLHSGSIPNILTKKWVIESPYGDYTNHEDNPERIELANSQNCDLEVLAITNGQ